MNKDHKIDTRGKFFKKFASLKSVRINKNLEGMILVRQTDFSEAKVCF